MYLECLCGFNKYFKCSLRCVLIGWFGVLKGEFSVPYAAHDICNQREKLREQREHVMLVVRAYNSECLHAASVQSGPRGMKKRAVQYRA